MSEQPVRYRFVGPPDTYIDGVPARDLTEDDEELVEQDEDRPRRQELFQSVRVGLAFGVVVLPK